jgi:hypothetical protein
MGVGMLFARTHSPFQQPGLLLDQPRWSSVLIAGRRALADILAHHRQ